MATPEAILVVEFTGNSDAELRSQVEKLKTHVQKLGYHGTVTIAETAKQQNDVWTVRKAGLGLLMSDRSEAKPVAFIEDAAVPVENLADYITDVENIIYNEGTTYAIYAHASAGCLHVRPLVNLKTLKGREQYRNISDQVTKTVKKYQGTITGEHGSGLVRGEYSEYLFGENITRAFQQVKAAFDPDNMMNPGKVVNTPKMDDASLMRYSPSYEVIPLKTRYDWSADNGLGGAVEMCNGAGVCRKEGTGTMCPSFMATADEAHSTRGRSNALRSAISGKLDGSIGSKALKEVFDLCLSCKACKSECPSSVDVARMKAEFLALYHDEHGIPLVTQLFGNIHRVNKLAGRMQGISNFMLTSEFGKSLMRVAGIPTERPLPTYTDRRFTRREVMRQHDEPDGILIVDTFTEWNHPELGQALVKIVTRLGAKLDVRTLPNQGCCGRPAISKGLLDNAKRMANDNVRALSSDGSEAPFIFLEPSCMSAFTDDYLSLVDKGLQPAAGLVASRCMSAEGWLAEQLAQRDNNLTWDNTPRDILLHGHCHQKSLWGTSDTVRLLQAIPNATVSEIDSGCCGVAGSFGYEHYDVSMKVANDRLLPAIEANPDAIVAAPGTSCRAQIGDAGHDVQHPVQIVASALV
jgi:Fe-S oxidoreductase